MARVTAEKRAELESFWRSHHEGWQASDLNQREYCELHGLPLKRFGNWRAQFRDEETAAKANLLWRVAEGLDMCLDTCLTGKLSPYRRAMCPRRGRHRMGVATSDRATSGESLPRRWRLVLRHRRWRVATGSTDRCFAAGSVSRPCPRPIRYSCR